MQSCKKLIFVRPFFFFHCQVIHTTLLFFLLFSFFFRQLHHQRPFFFFFFLSSSDPLHCQRFIFYFIYLFFLFFLLVFSFFLFSSFFFFFFFFLSFFFKPTLPCSPIKATSINPQPWLRTGFLLRWMGWVCLTKSFRTCLWWIACWVWTMMVLLAWDGIFNTWVSISFWVLWWAWQSRKINWKSEMLQFCLRLSVSLWVLWWVAMLLFCAITAIPVGGLHHFAKIRVKEWDIT